MATHLAQVISISERPSSQLREIFRTQISCAVRDVGTGKDAIPGSVHAARKQLKRARATLRLLRPSIGDVIYRQENVAVRDAARPLSGVRDSEVLLATFDKLVERSVEEDTSMSLEPLRTALQSHVERSTNPGRVDTERFAWVRESLISTQQRASRWPLQADDWQPALSGLARTYRRGRSDLKAARREPTTEHLHDWRKQAKYLWHQLQVLTPIAVGELGELSDQFHRLSDYLGDEHDLAVLEGTFARIDVELPGRIAALLSDAIERRRAQLNAKAFALGERLYAAKTGRFAERMDLLWNAWRTTTTRSPQTAEKRAPRSLPAMH